MIKDSGERREFDSGAVRDIQEGKGRFDLVPLREVSVLMKDNILHCIGEYMFTLDEKFLYGALNWFAKREYGEGDNEYALSNMILEVGIHYEEGCKKYGERNWEKGLPLHCFIDSGVRHYLKHLRGDTDERHDRAFVWNILGALWTIKNKPELNDLKGADNDEDRI